MPHVAPVARQSNPLGTIEPIEGKMIKSTRVSFSEAQINVLLRLTSTELLRQITHKAIDPLTAETAMRMVRAKEKFMPERKEDESDS